MSDRNVIGIGLLGLGVVGSGVAATLLRKAEGLAHLVPCPLALRAILVRDIRKSRPFQPGAALLTTRVADLLETPQTDIIIEVMGGERPALDYVERALRAKKHVVTANKELMAKHGPALLALAEEHGVQLRFEASVGGGIPIIGPLQRDLVANEITSIRAIINGTTNYILTKMARESLDFATALRQAQDLGYAEADPANDVDGLDAAYKLAILAGLAFRAQVVPSDVYYEGITRLHPKDFRYARELGYAIKLLAIATKGDGSIYVRVHPALVPEDTLLAKVDGAYNAVEIKGDLNGTVVFHGLGAGALPTTSAVLGDVVNIARTFHHGVTRGVGEKVGGGISPTAINPFSELRTQYYLRLNVLDRAGVLAQIAKVLGDHQISIASVIQKDTDPQAGTAELVISTHLAQEAAVQKALHVIARLEVAKEVSSLIRVEPL